MLLTIYVISQRYNLILMADTIWMSQVHSDLIKSIHGLLDDNGQVLLCCGLHTGKPTVDAFIRKAEASRLVAKLLKVKQRRDDGEDVVFDDVSVNDFSTMDSDGEDRKTVLLYELRKKQ